MRKERSHWKRDRIEDVLIHLYEWHRLTQLVQVIKGEKKSALLASSLVEELMGEMNVAFWEKHQQTSLEGGKFFAASSHKLSEPSRNLNQ